MNRASLFAGLLAGLFLLLPSSSSWAGEANQNKKRHAVSLIGEPKLPADFKHFEWANPDAPKGGTLKLAVYPGGFDSLNPFTVKGEQAAGLGLMHSTLMFSSPDEPSAEYGMIAEWISYPDDYASRSS